MMFVDAVIETDRLRIRPYQLKDVDSLYEVVSEPNFYQYVPEEVPTHDDVRKIVEWSMDCNLKNTPEKIIKFNLAIIDKEYDELIGYCGLGPFDLNKNKVELYFGLSEQYRGMGLAKEAASAVLNYGFNAIGLNEMVSTVHPDNIASVKILESLGFVYFNTLKDLPKNEAYFEGHSYYVIEK
jgi:[ribosomal protein S5]-alanine N-acetyltransferase